MRIQVGMVHTDMPSTPTRTQPPHAAKEKAWTSQTGISVTDEQISGDNIDGDQSILKQVKVQAERA